MKKSRLTKIKRDRKHKRHLKFLADNIHSGATHVTEEWSMTKSRTITKPYYKRIYRGNRSNNRYKLYKRVSNKKVRNYKGDISNGGAYKKVFDYWWSVD